MPSGSSVHDSPSHAVFDQEDIGHQYDNQNKEDTPQVHLQHLSIFTIQVRGMVGPNDDSGYKPESGSQEL